MKVKTQEQEFRSDFVLDRIIIDVEIKGQRKTGGHDSAGSIILSQLFVA